MNDVAHFKFVWHSHPSVGTQLRAQSLASRISVSVVYSILHFRNRRRHRIKQKVMSKEKVDSPERGPSMDPDEGDALEYLQWISRPSFAI